MAKKVQIQLLDEQTGAVIDDANPVTTADLVSFDDGQTFQQKYDAGLLKGQKGDTGAKGDQGVPGATGATGATGAKGDKGDPGDTVKVGTSTSTAVQRKLFFKVIG